MPDKRSKLFQPALIACCLRVMVMWESNVLSSSWLLDRYTCIHYDKKHTKPCLQLSSIPPVPHIWSPLGEQTCQQKSADQKCRKKRGSMSFHHTKHSFTLIHIAFISAHSSGVFHKEASIQSRQRLSHLDPKLKVAGQEMVYAVLVAVGSAGLCVCSEACSAGCGVSEWRKSRETGLAGDH